MNRHYSKHSVALVLAVFLAVVVAISPVPSVAHAQTAVAQGQCGGDVIMVASENDLPDAESAVHLRRIDPSSGEWQSITGEAQTAYWYCYDTSFWRKWDPRTWRFKSISADAACDEAGTSCVLSLHLGVGTAAVNGWYPERSNCHAGTPTHARLSPNQLVEILCG